MAISLDINGQTYLYPETGDVAWGPDATDWAVAVTSGMLQKAGGLFQLLAEADFGSAFGIKSIYFKSRTTNPADAGQIRLARVDTVSWRNEANDADLALSVNSSNALLFNGVAIGNFVSVTDTATIDLTLTGTALSADIKSDSITNAMINSAAAIVYSKLVLTNSIVNADINSAAAIAFSKLAALASGNILVGSVGNVATSVAVTGDIFISNAGVTGISSGVIVDADVNASAAIAGTKVAPAFGNQIVSTTASFQAAEISTPANPASGNRKLLAKTTGWYDLDSAGNETQLGGTVASLSSPTDNKNYSITATVAANALTITLKTKAGATPDSTSPVVIGFRNPTTATGDYETVSVVAATTIVVPSTATLGQVSGATEQTYVYLLNNSGTGELLVTTTPIGEQLAQTSTTISAGATSRTGIYSTTGRTSKAVRLLGIVQSTQTTAGTWATAPSQISIGILPVLPTSQGNSAATALGQKVYQHGTTYNNSIAPTITGPAGITIVGSQFVPYQVQTGGWRLRYNIDITYTSNTVADLTINGVTFAAFDQAGSAYAGASSTTTSRANSGLSTILLRSNPASVAANASGDVALASKPTWAY